MRKMVYFLCAAAATFAVPLPDKPDYFRMFSVGAPSWTCPANQPSVLVLSQTVRLRSVDWFTTSMTVLGASKT